MAKTTREPAELVRAAEQLEAAMAGLEGLARSARKVPLNSEKNIARASHELAEAMTLPARLGERLQAVGSALQRLQERQQAALESLATVAAEVQRRTQLLAQHMERFAALGRAAGEVSTGLAREEANREAVAQAEGRLKEISEEARALFETARADDFPEIAKEADVLKQRLASLRKRLSHFA